MGRDGIVTSGFCFDAPCYPGSHPQHRPQFDVVLHQTRRPLDTIASLQTTHTWRWVCQFLPVREDAPLLKRACYNWLVFNEAAERQAVLTYRIEALAEAWPELQRLLGFGAPYARIADLPHNINARKHGPVTWRQIEHAAPEIYDDIRDAARRYGYEDSDGS